MEIWLLIVLSIIIGLFSVAFLYFTLFRTKKIKQAFLVGCAGSGKTKLFYHLTTKQNFSTVTSQTKNEFKIMLNKQEVQLVDLPGHPRIRTSVLSTIKVADLLVFVIDSETVLNSISDIANLLYDVLCTPELIKKNVPILIVGSKTDIVGSRSIDIIEKELQSEIGFIRDNRQQSNYVDSSERSSFFLGEEGKEFEFSQLVNPISFATCSVNNDDSSQVMDFIEKMTK